MSTRLAELGERICILGPSGSGKSTLADSIARRLGSQAIHLDQLYHLPHTDWQIRPEEEFVALHDDAIAGERWVMDGNYSKCLPRRLDRATGLILLDIPRYASLFRYVRRAVFDGARLGTLEGWRDSIKWVMIHHIAIVSPRNRRRCAEIYRHLPMPKVSLPSMQAIDAAYLEWDLKRQSNGERAAACTHTDSLRERQSTRVGQESD